MKWTDSFIKRPVMAVALSIIIVILGLFGLSKLQIREYPELVSASVNVSASSSGTDALTIQNFVTSPLESKLATVENLDYMTSTSRQGSANITLYFQEGADLEVAYQNVLAAVQTAKRTLPSTVNEPVVTKATNQTIGQVYYAFSSDVLSIGQIVDYLNRNVAPLFYTVNGVADVQVQAPGLDLIVTLDPLKLAQHNLSPQLVTQMIAANNLQVSAGSLQTTFQVLSNNIDGSVKSTTELEELIIAQKQGEIIRLRDVATVELKPISDAFFSTVNGKPAATVTFGLTPSANPLTTVAQINEKFTNEVKQTIPNYIDAKLVIDSTVAIRSAITSVVRTVFEAVIIVMIVMLLFLGSMRSLLVPVIAIPISLMGNFVLLWLFGYSLNMITLLAIILAIGMVVDDAIVVLENIHRHISYGEEPFRAAIISTREIAAPVIVMTLTLAVVFLPIALSSGATGPIYQEFAVTLAGAVIISGVVSLTLSPMLTQKLFAKAFKRHAQKRAQAQQALTSGAAANSAPATSSPTLATSTAQAAVANQASSSTAGSLDDFVIEPVSQGHAEDHIQMGRFEKAVERTLEKITNGYTMALIRVLKQPKTIGFLLLMVMTTLFTLPGQIRSELTPAEDKGMLLVFSQGRANGTAEYNKLVNQKISEGIEQIPEVKDRLSLVTSGAIINIASLGIYGEDRDRTQAQIVADSGRFFTGTPGIQANLVSLPEIQTQGGGFLNFGIAIQSADNYDNMIEYATKFAQAMQDEGVIVIGFPNVRYNQSKVDIQIDREKAARYGVNISNIAQALGSYLSGGIAGRVSIEGQVYSLYTQLPSENRNGTDALDTYFVTSNTGVQIPLSELISYKISSQPSGLPRLNQLNAVSINGASILTLGEQRAWVEENFSNYFPAGYTYTWTGEIRQYEKEGNQNTIIFGLAGVLIFLVLALQFNSWRDGMVIMITVPLAVSGTLIAIYIGSLMQVPGATFNLYTTIGLVTLIGLITKHGILMCEVAREEQINHGRTRRQAIIRAAQLRFRPIMMTTLATVAGLVPLLISSGAGANARFAIALTIVSGLSIGTLFTLFILPTVYTWIGKKHEPLMEFDESIRPKADFVK